ncbi:MAG TPA: dihydropteroate synthase [Bacteroidia bacterium]|nr:dihydropteroate synthase [Bacteroidia bacterium]
MKPSVVENYQQLHVFNCKGRLLDLSTPLIMGILNVTPDSFYDGGKFTDLKAIVAHAGTMIRQGAAIIDIGAQSTRPGADKISPKKEASRLLPALEAVLDKFPQALVSVDTFYADVAQKAVEKGASIINDISGGSFDPEMFQAAGALQVPYILMHMKGEPATMQEKPKYKNVTEEVFTFFADTLPALQKAGVRDTILDPGFGFGKTTQHNFQLLNDLNLFQQLDKPILAGLSRKSLTYKTLGLKPEEALNGTTALNMVALQNGAGLLRVHDVKEAIQTVKLYLALKNAVTSHSSS